VVFALPGLGVRLRPECGRLGRNTQLATKDAVEGIQGRLDDLRWWLGAMVTWLAAAAALAAWFARR
jgi:hypothetical protein